jgi:pyruvate oxidase
VEKKRTVADALLSQLHEFGVDYIFGVSGDAILSLLDAMTRQEHIKFIATRHESAAGFMASAYAKLTGKLGVCIATSGPGLANLLNGLGDAYGDHVPVLAITGQVPTDKIGTDSKQYINQQQLVQPLAVYSEQITSSKTLVPLLQQAVRTAITRKAVTHLSVPKDVFTQSHLNQLIPANPFLYKQPPTELHNMRKSAVFLNQCKKPMILAGRGALGCREEIKRLASKLSSPVVCSLGAKGVIPEQFEWMVGGIGEGGSEEATKLLGECDGLLIIGARWYPKSFMSPSIPFVQIELEASHLHYDKNLYTALLGDAQEIAGVLEAEIQPLNRDEWSQKVKMARSTWLSRLEDESRDNSVPITPPRILKALNKTAAADAIITLDTGDHTVWFNRSFETTEQEVLFSGNWRTLGYGLPAANAAQLIYPDRQVIAIVGDGGFAMTMMELSTLVRYQLPVKLILFNNQSFAMEQNKTEGMGLTSYGNDLTNPNFTDLAQAFGIHSIRVTNPDQLEGILQEALKGEGPRLIEVMSSTKPTPLSEVKNRLSQVTVNV